MAIAAFPFSAPNVAAFAGSAAISASMRLSISLSTRLTKKLATDETRPIGFPAFARSASPAM